MMTYLKYLFFILGFGFCLGQEIDSTSAIESIFDVESVSIENFKEKNFLDSTFKCNKSKNQLKNVQFLNIELLLPEKDSIFFEKYDGKLELTSRNNLDDGLTFGLLESLDIIEPNLLYKLFQNNLINDVFSGQATDFGLINLDNLNKVYWIKSDISEKEFEFYTLTLFFEDVLSEKVFMIILGSSNDLNKAICKYYSSIQSILFKNP